MRTSAQGGAKWRGQAMLGLFAGFATQPAWRPNPWSWASSPMARLWGPMSFAMMGGLLVATVLTLIFLPALYAVWYRIAPARQDCIALAQHAQAMA